MNTIISRTFSDAFFAIDPNSMESLFFEGGSCRIAQRFLDEPDYAPTQSDFPEYNSSCWPDIREDCACLKEEIRQFLAIGTSSSQTMEDDASPEQEDETPLSRLKTYARESWQLTTADVELTHLCNCRCKFCYLESYQNRGLQLCELEKAGLAMRKAGIIFTSLTGGELFLRPDALDVLQMFQGLNFMLDIKSNGTLLDTSKIETLASLPIFDMQISIYDIADGLSTVTNRQYPFTKVAEGIKELVEAKVPLTLSVTVGRHNVDRLDEIHAAIKQIADIAIFYSPYITPRRSGADDGIKLRLSTKEMQEKLLPFLQRTGSFSRLEQYRDCDTCLHPCTAGITQIALDPLGNIYPCLDLPETIGNIRHGDVDKLLSVETRQHAIDKFRMSDMAQCLDCDVRGYCDSCVGIALLENGTYTRPARHKCDVVRFFTLNNP